VELYDDTGFDGDRGVMIDYVDRGLRDYENYDRVEGFEDKSSAARWCLPSGVRYRLFRHKGGCRGRSIDLIGTGFPASDPRFGDNSGVVRRFNDEVSCSRWIAPPPPPPPPPTPGGPDLVISSFTGGEFTVKNQGPTDAGPFTVRLSSSPAGDTNYDFTGLAAGATETRSYFRPCEEARDVHADSLNEVAESDETNNAAHFENSFC
jgi:CARDB